MDGGQSGQCGQCGQVCCLDHQPAAQFLGSSGTLRFMRNSRGYDLATYFWPSTKQGTTKGIVVAVHGHGSYFCYDFLAATKPGFLPTYKGSWIEKLNTEGYSVCGIDNQGAGRSGGLRCYVDKFEDFVEDVLQLARGCTSMGVRGFTGLQPAEHRTAVPKFLLGGSLGGCIATVSALTEPELFAGVVLLAPMLSLDKVSSKGLNRLIRPLSTIATYLVPTLPAAKTTKNQMYPELQALFDADPNCWHDATRVRNAAEYLRICAQLMGSLERITYPFLVFHSERDDMTDCDGSKALYLRAKSADKTLKLTNTFWHILTKEPGHQELLTEIIAWMDLRI